MEKINCIICKDYNDEPIVELINTELSKIQKFTLVRCVKCNLIYLNPRLPEKEIINFYKNNYYPHTTKPYTIFEKSYNYFQKYTFYWKRFLISHYIKKPGCILDIGSGNNKFSNYMQNYQWTTRNFDKFVNDTSNVNNLEQIEKQSCDIITMWHSLEHIYDVEDLFNSINKILKKNGFVFIACPNINAVERSFLKNNWIAYDAPRHLYHFSTESLKKLLYIHNLDIVKIYRMPQDTVFNILASINNKYFHKIILIIYSLIISLFFKYKSSSLLYVCKLK